MRWPVVREFCEHGCGEVVLVKSVIDARVFAYCPMCEAAWASPNDLVLCHYVICSVLAPAGVFYPSSDEVEASGWAPQVVGTATETPNFNLGVLNDYLVHEKVWRLKGNLPWQQKRRRETALVLLGIGAGLLFTRGLSALLLRIGIGDWVMILLGAMLVLGNSWLVSRPRVTPIASSNGNPPPGAELEPVMNSTSVFTGVSSKLTAANCLFERFWRRKRPKNRAFSS